VKNAPKNKIQFLMVDYVAKNQRKLTKIEFSQKGMILKLHQKGRKKSNAAIGW
jgi:hypothetical protein